MKDKTEQREKARRALEELDKEESEKPELAGSFIYKMVRRLLRRLAR